MLRQLAAGDMAVVTRIDRLARSTFDLFAIVKQIADAGARFRSLAEPWADTGTSTGRLMLAVLGGLALRLVRSVPRCSLRGRSGARHPRHARAQGCAARGSGWLRSSQSPPLRAAAWAAPGRDGKAGSPIEQESGVLRDPIDNVTRRREHPGEAMLGPSGSIAG